MREAPELQLAIGAGRLYKSAVLIAAWKLPNRRLMVFSLGVIPAAVHDWAVGASP